MTNPLPRLSKVAVNYRAALYVVGPTLAFAIGPTGFPNVPRWACALIGMIVVACTNLYAYFDRTAAANATDHATVPEADPPTQ